MKPIPLLLAAILAALLWIAYEIRTLSGSTIDAADILSGERSR